MSAIKLGNSNIILKVGDSSVTAAYLGSTLVYSPTPPTPHDYSQDYLTFRALEDGTFSFGGSGAISANTLEYSVDSGATWSTLQNGGTTPTVTSGNTILWKASGLTISGNGGIGKFSSTGQFEAEGNIMSLHFGDDFSGQTSLSGMNNTFANLFRSCTGLTSAENLVLPATTLAEKCYYNMFYGCNSLTTAPSILPATTLANRCYVNMFYDCNSLTTTPSLPATTLANECYTGMFFNCTSLTTAPELPATTLAARCYYQMFFNCTSLNSITCLATDISANYCIRFWVTNVASSGTFTKAASMTSWTTGSDGIPSGWTVVDYNPPTPTGYTYSVTIQGLENGDTTTISWDGGIHIDHNVGNGTYTYTTTANTIPVDIAPVTEYSLDYSHLDLYSGGSQTVTFTYQGGLESIPYETDMRQYYGRYVRRLVINDPIVNASGAIFQNWYGDYISLSPWQISGGGQFSSINSLPIDITLSGQGAQLNFWGYDGTTLNHLNDLQIEWA